MSELKSSVKPFEISKWEVWRAYEKVKANKGGPGVDGVDLAAFEEDLQNNLYKIWNRMSSGSYFPPPVRAVEIPKPHGGGTRILGVPTVGDRIAQTVVAARLEEKVEPIFHPDSYGYRPGRSPLDAVGACRARCWEYDWVIDLDVQKFFDSVSWDLVVKAVAAHTDLPWVLLYVKRWLAAPMQLSDGTLHDRDRGTPQGSAISPVLANLFLHYAFDAWMARNFPDVPFERFADDAVVHCVSQQQAEQVRAAIEDRMVEVGLRLHPDKTKIVYCQDVGFPSNRGGFLLSCVRLDRSDLLVVVGREQLRRAVPSFDVVELLAPGDDDRAGLGPGAEVVSREHLVFPESRRTPPRRHYRNTIRPCPSIAPPRAGPGTAW